jgi:hypothetical protein
MATRRATIATPSSRQHVLPATLVGLYVAVTMTAAIVSVPLLSVWIARTVHVPTPNL